MLHGVVGAFVCSTPEGIVTGHGTGVDANFRFHGKVTDSEVTFSQLTSGKTLKVRLTAANSAGESLPGAEALLLWNSPVQGMVLTCAALQSMKWYPPLLGGTSLYSNVVLETTDPEVLKNAFGTLITTMTFTATESPGARQQAYAKRIVTFPETKTWEIPAAITPFYDFMHMLTMVVNAEKKFDADLIKKAFDATKNYDGMIGRISFTPQNHCALDGDQMVMVTLLSGKSPKAMGCFRELA